jgi:hypothetical protein
VSTNPIADAQVEWYRSNGRHPDRRIVRDASGRWYVIGDWSWNRNPRAPHEEIEAAMSFELRGVYDAAFASIRRKP